jgi:hypothetical protein
MQPGEVYVLAIFATAVLVAPFNALARVIVLVWCGSHLAFLEGVDELQINLVGHMAGLLIGARYLRTSACILAYGLFVPLIAVDALRLSGAGDAVTMWWAVLLTAFAQLSFLPFGIEWAQVRALRERGIKGWLEGMPSDYLRVLG